MAEGLISTGYVPNYRIISRPWKSGDYIQHVMNVLLLIPYLMVFESISRSVLQYGITKVIFYPKAYMPEAQNLFKYCLAEYVI